MERSALLPRSGTAALGRPSSRSFAWRECKAARSGRQQLQARSASGDAAAVGRAAAASGQPTSLVFGDSGGDSADSGDTVRLFYDSGWDAPRLHASLRGGDWRSYPLAQQMLAGRRWHTLDLPVPAAIPAVPAAVPAASRGIPASGGTGAAAGGEGRSAPSVSLLEFVATDGGEAWDKPQGGGNYVIPGPGTFRVEGGRVAPVADRPPVLVVSDLDDTMIGDDDATLDFRRYWEGEGSLRGGMLAYNTGRALPKFEALLQERGHVLPLPDALISSVGTKLYERGADGVWREDAGYAALLGRGWDLAAVRDATYSALAAAGDTAMHFRPADEQNEHKVTCGVACAQLEAVLQHIRAKLDARGVQAQLITSGKGDWRFLDVVPLAAGKLPALEFVRRRWGFGLQQTVACGDSGNDIDMLSGENLAIAVGNAQPDLVAWLDGLPPEAAGVELVGGRVEARLYRARGSMAAGVLEGLQHFGFL